MKNLFHLLLFFLFGIGLTFASAKLLKTGNNWDANVSSLNSANDIFTLSGRLDLEDSRTSSYSNGYRGKITGDVESDLFGKFNIESPGFSLKFLSKDPSSSECQEEGVLEKYTITGKINSNNWGELTIQPGSYFCSNQYAYIKFKSDSIGEKEIGNGTNQNNLIDDFGKQEIAISGITKLKGNTDDEILNRGDGKFNNLGVSISSKTIANKNISKNIINLFRTYKNFVKSNEFSLNDFNNSNIKNNYGEKFYLFDYTGKTENISFKGSIYKNKGKILNIGTNGNNKIEINGKNTVIVKGGNIYINSNLYNKNSNSLLVLVAKRDKNTKNGGNIYIDPNVTNIDAILISDGSLLSMGGGVVQSVSNSSQVNNLRKQLLIYGSVLSANVVGSDKIPYGADLYEKGYTFINNDNIYDLGNLRTFNLNYGGGEGVISGCNDNDKLTPINIGKYAWAGKKECYIDDSGDSDLRKSEKNNPLIIEYNTVLQLKQPYILKSN